MRWACALPLSLCGGSRPCAARAGAPRAPPLHRVYVGCHPRRAQARWRTPRLLRRAATDGADGASVETRASTASDSPAEQRLAELLAELPVGEVVDELLQALERAPNAVLEAAPGAGKTTCLPLAILQRAKWLPEGHTILVLEPRRLAARAAATRMAEILGESVGQTVGYRMRMDTKVSRATRVEVVTDGILLRRLQGDPALEGCAAVLLDEFHERSLEVDTALALCKEVQAILRPELRLLVMSATLGPTLIDSLTTLLRPEPEAVAATDTDGATALRAPLVRSKGRSYPLTTHYAGAPAVGHGEMERAMVRVVRQALSAHEGDVLCFLPGAGEIRRVQTLLEDTPDCDVLPLYGMLSQAMQDKAIKPHAGGRRRIVLASPVAESSLTIPGVRVVVDSGLCRAPRFNAGTGLTQLHVTPISQASATQRAGRAAREGPGACYRLWSQATHAQRDESATPGIFQQDLTGTLLDLAIWGVRPEEVEGLGWVDPPREEQLEYARSVLFGLGAVDAKGLPTQRGRQLGSLPLHPRLAHLIIRGWELGWGQLACEMAALLEERDILRGSNKVSDLRVRIDVLRGVSRSEAAEVDRGAVARLKDQVQRLQRIVKGLSAELGPEGAGVPDSLRDLEEADAVGTLLACAYPDRVAQRRDRGSATGSATAFLLCSGRGVTFPQSSSDPMALEDYLVVADVGAGGKSTGYRGGAGGSGSKGGGSVRNDLVFLAAPVRVAHLAAAVEGAVTTRDNVFWADASKAVLARRQSTVGSIVVQESPLDNPPAELVERCLLDAVRRVGVARLLPWPKAAVSWRQRLQWVRRRPGAPDLPDLSDEALTDTLEEWLLPMIAGGKFRTKAHLAQLDMLSILKNQLAYSDQQIVDEWAPSSVTVPSGRKVSISYEDDVPAIEVKIQEMFGAERGPTIAGGSLPLQLQLMSPATRPAAVTQDLTSFWAQSYPAVRKDLAGRYPRHSWPEDPLTATPPSGFSTLKSKVTAPACDATDTKPTPTARGKKKGGKRR